MKSTIGGITLIILAGALGAPAFSGCAGTATRESTGEYVDDSVITTKVKAALLGDRQVSGMSVNVETFKGAVQLSGFVDTEAERMEAERIAAGVSGVRSVSNNIIVKSSGGDSR